MFVVEFGSHVRNPMAVYDPVYGPRDIDVLYNGMSEEIARTIVVCWYPYWTGPIDLTETSKPIIPIPYDSKNRDVVVLYPPNLKVSFKSVRRNVGSVFREGAGFYTALQRLEKGDFMFDLVEQINSGKDEKKVSLRDTYGRASIRRSALLHFGKKNIELLYEKLWWGPFLKLYLSTDKFSENGMKEIREQSSGKMTIRLNNKKCMFICNRSKKEGRMKTTWDLETIIDVLKR